MPSPRNGYCRPDDFDFFAAQVATFAGMRVEPADQDARLCDMPNFVHIMMENAQHPGAGSAQG
jgi:hypothetical protein